MERLGEISSRGVPAPASCANAEKHYGEKALQGNAAGFMANPVKMLSGILKKWLQGTISESVAEQITSLFLKFLERASEQVQVNEKQTATHIFLERVKNQFLSLPSTLSLQAGIW